MLLRGEIILCSTQISGDVYWMRQQRRRTGLINYLLCGAAVSLHVDVGLLLLLLLFGVVSSVAPEGPAGSWCRSSNFEISAGLR